MCVYLYLCVIVFRISLRLFSFSPFSIPWRFDWIWLTIFWYFHLFRHSVESSRGTDLFFHRYLIYNTSWPGADVAHFWLAHAPWLYCTQVFGRLLRVFSESQHKLAAYQRHIARTHDIFTSTDAVKNSLADPGQTLLCLYAPLYIKMDKWIIIKLEHE